MRRGQRAFQVSVEQVKIEGNNQAAGNDTQGKMQVGRS
jgi:hypothetical protein